MVPRSRLHACSGWLRVCCWAVMCCVRAGHVAAGVAARRHVMRPEERVIIIPVLVDRFNNSPFYSVWCCLSVYHFERAWSAIGSNLICHTD